MRQQQTHAQRITYKNKKISVILSTIFGSKKAHYQRFGPDAPPL